MKTIRLILPLCLLVRLPVGAAPAVILPGDPEAPLKSVNSEIVSARHPALWIASIRASAYSRGHEPYLAIDGKPETDWRVSGPPPAPMARGNWLEIELNEPALVSEVEVEWLGEAPYDYTVYKKPRDDFREPVATGRSAGGRQGLEKIALPGDVFTRTLRIEFATAAGNPPQGIREVRIGGVPFPAGYPQAADKFAPVEAVRRILYVEFERLPYVTVFNPKLPYADGGTGLRLMPTEEFEGGCADFTIAATPGKDNWITLKVWESHDVSMTQRGDLIAIETLDGDPAQRGRTFFPDFVTDQQRLEQEWYGGLKPQPGRWSYAHYKIPAAVVGNRNEIKLRLQGVGNVRRDYPMRSPAPTIYSITSGPSPSLGFQEP